MIRLEEAAMFAGCLFGLFYLDVEWWYYPILFIGPDISMIGYMVSSSVGAMTYNLFHHKALAVALLILGVLLKNSS